MVLCVSHIMSILRNEIFLCLCVALWSWTVPAFSNFNVYVNSLKIWLQCTFLFADLWSGPRCFISKSVSSWMWCSWYKKHLWIKRALIWKCITLFPHRLNSSFTFKYHWGNKTYAFSFIAQIPCLVIFSPNNIKYAFQIWTLHCKMESATYYNWPKDRCIFYSLMRFKLSTVMNFPEKIKQEMADLFW